MDWKEKTRYWCSKSERSKGEVIDRLKKLGVQDEKANRYIQKLENTGFIDETRFINAYIHDHFHLKNWGPSKINAGLRGKKCSFEDIQMGMTVLTKELVQEKLREVIRKRFEKNATDSISKKQKVVRYLQSRGYSMQDIFSSLDKIF